MSGEEQGEREDQRQQLMCAKASHAPWKAWFQLPLTRAYLEDSAWWRSRGRRCAQGNRTSKRLGAKTSSILRRGQRNADSIRRTTQQEIGMRTNRESNLRAAWTSAAIKKRHCR